MNKKEISLRKWLQRYWLGMFLFLLIVYFIAQAHLFVIFTDRVEKSIQKNVSIASDGIEDSLEIVDGFIYEALYSGTTQTTSQLYDSLKNETDAVALSAARSTVISSLQSITTWSDMIDFILLYTDRKDEPFWMETGMADTFQARVEVKDYLMDIISKQELSNLGRYMVCSGKTHNYMLRLIKIEESYLVVGVSEDKILSTLAGFAYDDDSIAFAADESGRVIFSSETMKEKLSLGQEGTYIHINDKNYLQTGYVSEATGYYFGLLTSKESIASDMQIFSVVYVLAFLVLMLLVPGSFYLISRYVEKPIESLSGTMNQISEGELDVIVEERPQITELAQFVKAFNHMIERIKQLKIEKYEVKLEAQKATMQYLQLQIKPHFYANVLNIIYSLAERKDFTTIQKMSNAIVNYSRYMFRDASELVELQREVEHVNYYMEIQKIRYMMQIVCNIEAPEKLKRALVPPFIIQSFVENSVKYAFTSKRNCEITIQIKSDNENNFLSLIIRDNGRGYSDELLQMDWEEKSESGHIGLENVYKRLKLIYNDKAKIYLKNDGGAVTTIVLPYISVDNMEFDDEK